jgi:hypothetical protein
MNLSLCMHEAYCEPVTLLDGAYCEPVTLLDGAYCEPVTLSEESGDTAGRGCVVQAGFKGVRLAVRPFVIEHGADSS